MNRILVPLDDFSDACLKASYYAIELAKRTNSRLFFLFISDSPKKAHLRGGASLAKMKEKISALLDQGHQDPLEAEYYFRGAEYCKAVEEFARNHKVSRIVVGLPHHDDVCFQKVSKNIESMKSRVKCQLVVVKSKSARLH